MKNRLYILGLAFCMSVTSCESFLDVNNNPNQPVTENLPLSAKLPAALVSSVNQETIQLNQLGALWGGYWGTANEGISLFTKEKSYNGPAIRHQRDGIPIWENGYANLLYYQLIKEEAQTKQAMFYSGVAKIMQGWHFMRLVDLYNNVPFDDALQGTKHPTPRYESGKTVYEKSLNLITEGIQDIKNAPAVSVAGKDDLIFGGDKTKWVKFGNTIKLRALLRQSEANNQAYITAELQKIAAEGTGFLGAGESALVQPGYLNTTGKLNPLWETYYRNVQGVSTNNHLNLRPTVFVLQQYTQRNDPRVANLYTQVAGSYKGVLFGNPNNQDPQYNRANTSAFKGPQENGNRPGAIFKAFGQASVLMGSFESLFLQAEAAQRGWITGSAKNLYELAIQESFKYMEVPAAEFNTYNNQASVQFDQATDKIERIIQQKWLALNGISSIEAWNDYRRLGIPNLPNSLLAPSATARPQRLMYPETERQTNDAEAAKQGPDDILTAKVWWDQ